MNKTFRFCSLFALAIAVRCASAEELNVDRELAGLIGQLDNAQYEISAAELQMKAFDVLRTRAVELQKRYPNRAEPLVLEGYVLATRAFTGKSMSERMVGGQAIEKLEAAIAIDPAVYGALPYALLGNLNLGPAQVMPSFMGFEKKARAYLLKELAIDSHGLEQNLGMARLLVLKKNYDAALPYANTVLRATPRPSREKADADLRAQAEALIAQAKEKLRND